MFAEETHPRRNAGASRSFGGLAVLPGRRRVPLACGWCLWLAIVLADDLAAPAERLALARAHTALVEVVLALPIDGRESLRHWAADDWSREAALRAWLWQRPRFGPLRRFSTGEVAADLRVDVSDLTGLLSALQPDARFVVGADRQAVWTTGRGNVTETLPPHPPGWENVAPADLALARQAATAAAWERVLTRAETLAYQPGMTLRAALTDPAFRAALRRHVPTLGSAETELLDCQVVAATASISPAQFVQALQQTEQAISKDAPRDFRGLLLARGVQRALQATARATPPRTTAAPDSAASAPAPAWAGRVLRVAVEVPDQPEVFRRPERIMAALRVAADPVLMEKVQRLGLPGGGSVADLLADNDTLRADLRTCISGGRVRDLAQITRAGDAGDAGESATSVTGNVELVLDTVWRLVLPHARQATTRPATTQPAATSQPAETRSGVAVD